MTTNTMPPPRPRRHVLLVEDNQADVWMVERAFRTAKVNAELRVVTNGEAALLYLRRQDPHQHVVKPDLVILDLNLPRISGREILGEMRRDAALRRIPVVVLTGSQADTDIFDVYDLGANAVITKPSDLSVLVQVVSAIDTLWFVLAQLPPR